MAGTFTIPRTPEEIQVECRKHLDDLRAAYQKEIEPLHERLARTNDEAARRRLFNELYQCRLHWEKLKVPFLKILVDYEMLKPRTILLFPLAAAPKA